MPAPADRRYAETHEWHKQDGDVVTIGITQFAADELTDITYVDLPQPGKKVEAGKRFGEIESVKATSELYSAVTGEVLESNPALKEDPSLVNQDPYGKGWLIKLKAPARRYIQIDDIRAVRRQAWLSISCGRIPCGSHRTLHIPRRLRQRHHHTGQRPRHTSQGKDHFDTDNFFLEAQRSPYQTPRSLAKNAKKLLGMTLTNSP